MTVTKRNFSKRYIEPSTFKKMPVCRRPGSTPSTSVRRATAPVSLSREESAELEALAQLLPPHNRHLNNDPCLILQAAAQYIDQLRTTIAARVRNRTLPADAISKIFQLQGVVRANKRKNKSKQS
ncbi:hypothetical protein Tcan_09498 [Toxocara canis]|uniref:Uncharacterized protein n=1 Tax=Toxocara canis TaxID=6265 RepID=A0A0B2VYG0_TOXCA|nr:hypothetical protein Tcan_09498 [Toxocara canis]